MSNNTTDYHPRHEGERPRWPWQRGRAVGGVAASETVSVENLPPHGEKILDMNLAANYGVQWNLSKCGRDAWQNFFDQNGGTLDGVRSTMHHVETPAGPRYIADIQGDGTYDYRLLTVIGATTKKTGEMTAGGFGEGAKILALSLLRDHGADSVEYRSGNWRLEFFIDDMDHEKVAHPTRGLFAKVSNDLPYQRTSDMRVVMQTEEGARRLLEAKKFFRSSENPDFKNPVLHKTDPVYGEMGVAFLGSAGPRRLYGGRLYVAGQQREYAPYGHNPRDDSWNNVGGISVWTSRDISPGDRDRGALDRHALTNEVFKPLTSMLEPEDIRRYFTVIEPVYVEATDSITDIGDLSSLVAKRAKELGVTVAFDPKYVAVGLEGLTIGPILREAGYSSCPLYFADAGMQTSKEVMALLHEHQRVEPNPEQLVRLDLLQDALGALVSGEALKKKIEPKDIWLFSRKHEKSPFEGTYNGMFVWISEEHMQDELPAVLATYLHELDHHAGSDYSAEFSYALTDTLAEILQAIVTKPDIATKLAHLQHRWNQSLQKEAEMPSEQTDA